RCARPIKGDGVVDHLQSPRASRLGNGIVFVESDMSMPMRRTRLPCCARAASGHAAAPPRVVMNSRRRLDRGLLVARVDVAQELSPARLSGARCASGDGLQLVVRRTGARSRGMPKAGFSVTVSTIRTPFSVHGTRSPGLAKG